ncbi:hypothetical protein Trydic_g11935 [Trypoxylus dichotomus]
MLCLNWCVVSLVLRSLLLINECVCRENYLGQLKDDIVRRNVLQTSGEFDNKAVRLKRQGPRNIPIVPLRHPPPHSRHAHRPDNVDHRSRCVFEPWMMPPGLRGRNQTPPGQIRRDKLPPGLMNKPCGFNMPPGHRKRIWPPRIAENYNDFKYPNAKWNHISQNETENNVVYIHKRPVILLRPQEIRK